MTPPGLCILGAAGDTTNLGVDALLESTLIGLRRSVPDAVLTVFDNGLGQREGHIESPTGPVPFRRLGIRLSRRIHRPESLANMTLSARTGFPPNDGVRTMRSAAAVLDLSGGDSFSDIYGSKRFAAITKQKSVSLRTGTPLVLLPQTYGPFEHPANRAAASDLVRAASRAWARDADSFDMLRSLLGPGFDEQRHHLGVDVAFALPSRPPVGLDRRIARWLDAPDPVFGLIVSGLLANGERSQEDFGLRENYTELVHGVLRRMLDETEARIVLIPHVLSDLWVVESDVAANRLLAAEFGRDFPDRVAALEGIDRAQEVKWVIGRCDAFCGTRMHSTIAALSTRTPALAFAYSPKTHGVFGSCGQPNRVADLRRDRSAQVEQQVIDLWNERTTITGELERCMPRVEAQAVRPFEDLAAMVESVR